MTPTSQNIGSQLGEFLRSTLDTIRPAWIFTVERKGTALLRSVVESKEGAGPNWRGWERVLSHETLEEIPTECLQDGPILLLDDSIYSGHKLNAILGNLQRRNVPRERIKTAVFSVHEKCSLVKPDIYWFGQLSDSRYKEIRKDIIAYFQRRGSLLLDTEHIEVPVDLECGRLEFFEHLSKAGIAVEHVSGGGRINLTIYNPVILDEAEFERRLPSETITRSVIRKIRVVERDNNRYAIIPIFYPSVPTDSTAESLRFLGEPFSSLAGGEDKNFHLVGIFSALQLFHTVFAALKDLVREQKVWIRNPMPDDVDDCLSHLSVLFPSINLLALHHVIQERIDAGVFGQVKKGIFRSKGFIDASKDSKYSEEMESLRWCMYHTITRCSDNVLSGPSGALMLEIFKPVQESIDKDGLEIEVKEALLSAVIDQAIDEAELHADTQSVLFEDGKYRMTRVFKLDNELIKAQVRRAISMWRSFVPWRISSQRELNELEY